MYSFCIFYRYFEQGYETKTLWIIYFSTSLVIPILVIITSLGNGNFGIPQTFIKSYVSDVTLCTYEGKWKSDSYRRVQWRKHFFSYYY